MTTSPLHLAIQSQFEAVRIGAFFGDYPNPKRGRSSTRRQGPARYEEGSHIASFRCVPPFIFSILSAPNRLFLWAKFGNFFVCSRQTIVCSDQTMVCCRQTMVCSRQTKRRSLARPKKASTARLLRKTKSNISDDYAHAFRPTQPPVRRQFAGTAKADSPLQTK